MTDWFAGVAGGVACVLVMGFWFLAGWVFAHNDVKTECNRLGAFYVGSKVYECKVREQK